MTKHSKEGTHHAHHHSVALNSPNYQHAISSSTGSTKELKTVSNRGQNKSEGKTNLSRERYNTINDLINSQGKPKHTKAVSMSNYHHSIEAYSSKTKVNALNQKPTYIILTIDNSGDKGSVKKKDTPKSSTQTLIASSYAKQGQSYQQLSSLKKVIKKKPTHQRTKSDHIIKSKPSINFKMIKGHLQHDLKQAKNLAIIKNKMTATKSSFTFNNLTKSNKMSKEWLLNKPKYDNKLVKGPKPAKDGISKHKRVKSDMNNSKKLLKTVARNNTVYTYTNKKSSTTAATTRIMKENKAVISRGHNVSESNTFKKPKGYKIIAKKKSAENSPSTNQNHRSIVTEFSGRPPTVTKVKSSTIR
jgi:hypothetical protein